MNLRSIKPLFYPYQLYKYIIFYPCLGLGTALTTILGTIWAIITFSDIKHFFGMRWARFLSFTIPMSVTTYGIENVDKKQSYVVVSNHQSQCDIFAIYGWLPVNFRWVLKKQLRKIPFLGYFCYRAGHIFIDRSNSETAIASINSAKRKLLDGTSIFFFPEGTRSDDGNLIPFKKGAFRFALDMKLPILPITICGTKNVLPNNSTALFPGKARLTIHEPIPITEYNSDNIEELISRSKNVIQTGLDDYK